MEAVRSREARTNTWRSTASSSDRPTRGEVNRRPIGSEQRGLDEPEGRLRSVLGAEQEELGGLEARRPPNEPGRGSAQEHLADPCRSRELIGLVDRSHGQKALLVLRELDEHLAQRDPDSQVELRPLGGVRSGRPEAELGRGSNGSNGVVLMDPGDSEDGADPSDHHLVHPAAVALDDRQRLLHREVHRGAAGLRIVRRLRRREPADERRDALPRGARSEKYPWTPECRARGPARGSAPPAGGSPGRARSRAPWTARGAGSRSSRAPRPAGPTGTARSRRATGSAR